MLSLFELLAHRRLRRSASVQIAANAKIRFRKIRMSPNSHLQVGEGSIIEAELVSERQNARIIVGNRSFIGNSLLSCATRIEVGDDVLISWGCSIVDHNSHPISWDQRKNDVGNWYHGEKDWARVETASILIGNKSWLGFNVGILKGVEIGEGAIVGAGSVVTKNVDAWTIVAGNPAKLIREIPIEER